MSNAHGQLEGLFKSKAVPSLGEPLMSPQKDLNLLPGYRLQAPGIVRPSS